MSSLFDVIIIGAGPAGLNAALHLLKSPTKPSVLIVDKIAPWERPIACAEGVWRDPFNAAVPMRPEWVRFFISKAVLHSPDNTDITYFEKNKGCIINRALMQRDLARECEKLGALVRCNCKVVDVGIEIDGERVVIFSDDTSIKAGVVIDASGPIGGFGKKEKIAWKPLDLEPAYFGVAENIPIENDAVHVYIGREVAPGGYAWAFPRENGAANVGIVVGKPFIGKVNIKALFESFVSRNFPHAKVAGHFAGTIPCEAGKLPVSAPRFLKAGDAASVINPISRAGIVEALVSGGLAGDYALRMLSAKSRMSMNKASKEYYDAWQIKMGKAHCKLSRAKRALLKVPDSDFDRAFKALKAIPQNKLAMSKIIGLSLGRFPRLVWAIRHLM